MSRRWVVNASPLILLGKIGHVALLRDLSDELIVPDAVVREIGAKPDGERVLIEIASLSGARIEAESPVLRISPPGISVAENLRSSPWLEPPQAAALSWMTLKPAVVRNHWGCP